MQTFPTGELTIESASGPHKFHVEIATTPAQIEQGLMFRRTLAPDAGMLFDFKTPSPVSMWMKNTFIPLDMLFIDAGGRIINIAERDRAAIARSRSPPPRRPAPCSKLNGGTAARLGIRPGDRVVFPIFGNAS